MTRKIQVKSSFVITSGLHGHRHELCKHVPLLNWILLMIELSHS